MIRLTAVIDGEGQAPRALTLESNARSLIIGRDATADFQIPLPTVSRHHARIVASDGIYVIEDLGSTHGTRVNDKPLVATEKKVLRGGDVIGLTRASITCAIESDKVASVDPFEGSGAVAARAVQGILGRIGNAKQSAPYLRALTGTMSGTRYPLESPLTQWTLGRSNECECMLDDVNVSRRHALLKKDWSGFLVEDLGSKNGVLVNDIRIRRRRRLKNEDELTIGPVRLVFVDPDADLLDALKGVPGFEVEEAQDEDEASDIEAMQAANQGEPMGHRMSADGPAAAELPPMHPAHGPDAADDDGLGDLDPSLLEQGAERAWHTWAVAGGALTLIAGAGVALYLVFG